MKFGMKLKELQGNGNIRKYHDLTNSDDYKFLILK